MKEYRNNDICGSCKDHQCCKKSWTRTDIGKIVHGVEPLFDIKDKERLREEGQDVSYCNYMGEDGCIIPWEKRPKQCKAYRCWEWLKKVTRNPSKIREMSIEVQSEVLLAAKEDAEEAKKAFEEILSGKS